MAYGYHAANDAAAKRRLERVAIATELRQQGLNNIQIGERLGVAAGTVSRFLSDPTGEKTRAVIAKSKARNYEKYREVKQRWHHANKEHVRRQSIARRYGLRPEDLDALREAQGGKCAICARSMAGHRNENVDHCHASGRVRALLCGHCNRGLGCVQDNTETLRQMIAYLDRHSVEDR